MTKGFRTMKEFLILIPNSQSPMLLSRMDQKIKMKSQSTLVGKYNNLIPTERERDRDLERRDLREPMVLKTDEINCTEMGRQFAYQLWSAQAV